MRRPVILATALTLSTALWLSCTEERSPISHTPVPLPGPVLSISQDTFEFGYTPQNAKVAHTFWLKSIGDEPVVISRITPGCGCIKAPLDTDIIQPGDSTRLEILFSTKSYRGWVSKRARIDCNSDPGRSYVEFTAHILALPDSAGPVVIDPCKISFSNRDNPNTWFDLEIRNESSRSVGIRLIESPGDYLQVTYPPYLRPNASGRIGVRLRDLGEQTAIDKSFTIEVENGLERARYTIPLHRILRPE